MCFQPSEASGRDKHATRQDVSTLPPALASGGRMRLAAGALCPPLELHASACRLCHQLAGLALTGGPAAGPMDAAAKACLVEEIVEFLSAGCLGDACDQLLRRYSRRSARGAVADTACQARPALRPFVFDPTLRIPVTFAEFTSLITPTVNGQPGRGRTPADGGRESATVAECYRVLGVAERVQYLWYAGDHDFPPVARRAAVEFFAGG